VNLWIHQPEFIISISHFISACRAKEEKEEEELRAQSRVHTEWLKSSGWRSGWLSV
jgi:hypothetical protein